MMPNLDAAHAKLHHISTTQDLSFADNILLFFLLPSGRSRFVLDELEACLAEVGLYS